MYAFIFRSNVFWLFKLSPSSKMKNVCRDQIKALEMWEDLLETSQVTEDKIRGKVFSTQHAIIFAEYSFVTIL